MIAAENSVAQYIPKESLQEYLTLVHILGGKLLLNLAGLDWRNEHIWVGFHEVDLDSVEFFVEASQVRL